MKLTIEEKDFPLALIKVEKLIELRKDQKELAMIKTNPKSFVYLAFKSFVNQIINYSEIEGNERTKPLALFLKERIPPNSIDDKFKTMEEIWKKFLEFHENDERRF